MNKKFFGEIAYYLTDSEEEKQKALDYLNFWKKNLLFKLRKDSFEIKIVDEQWIERDSIYIPSLDQNASIALKLHLEADFHYELGK